MYESSKRKCILKGVQLQSPIQIQTLTLQKRLFNLLQWKPLKKEEKCFLFHLKRSFRSQDI